MLYSVNSSQLKGHFVIQESSMKHEISEWPSNMDMRWTNLTLLGIPIKSLQEIRINSWEGCKIIFSVSERRRSKYLIAGRMRFEVRIENEKNGAMNQKEVFKNSGGICCGESLWLFTMTCWIAFDPRHDHQHYHHHQPSGSKVSNNSRFKVTKKRKIGNYEEMLIILFSPSKLLIVQPFNGEGCKSREWREVQKLMEKTGDPMITTSVDSFAFFYILNCIHSVHGHCQLTYKMEI